MISQKRHLQKKALGFIFNIGADPRDSDYIRLIKRIWYASYFGEGAGLYTFWTTDHPRSPGLRDGVGAVRRYYARDHQEGRTACGRG